MTSESSRSPEQFITGQLAGLKENAQRCLDDLAAQAQLQPHKTLLCALGAGYLLRTLPLTSMISGVGRLAVALLKPAAIIYGVSKVWQATQKNSTSPERETD